MLRKVSEGVELDIVALVDDALAMNMYVLEILEGIRAKLNFKPHEVEFNEEELKIIEEIGPFKGFAQDLQGLMDKYKKEQAN